MSIHEDISTLLHDLANIKQQIAALTAPSVDFAAELAALKDEFAQLRAEVGAVSPTGPISAAIAALEIQGETVK